MAGAASRQVCLAFRLTPGPATCQTRSAIDCVILRQPGTPRPGADLAGGRLWPPDRACRAGAGRPPPAL